MIPTMTLWVATHPTVVAKQSYASGSQFSQLTIMQVTRWASRPVRNAKLASCLRKQMKWSLVAIIVRGNMRCRAGLLVSSAVTSASSRIGGGTCFCRERYNYFNLQQLPSIYGVYPSFSFYFCQHFAYFFET